MVNRIGAKTAEPIDMLFRVVGRVGPINYTHVSIVGNADLRMRLFRSLKCIAFPNTFNACKALGPLVYYAKKGEHVGRGYVLNFSS